MNEEIHVVLVPPLTVTATYKFKNPSFLNCFDVSEQTTMKIFQKYICLCTFQILEFLILWIRKYTFVSMAAQAYYTDHYIFILSSDYVHIMEPVPTVNEVSLRLFFILRSTLHLYPVLFIDEYMLVLSIPV